MMLRPRVLRSVLMATLLVAAMLPCHAFSLNPFKWIGKSAARGASEGMASSVAALDAAIGKLQNTKHKVTVEGFIPQWEGMVSDLSQFGVALDRSVEEKVAVLATALTDLGNGATIAANQLSQMTEDVKQAVAAFERMSDSWVEQSHAWQQLILVVVAVLVLSRIRQLPALVAFLDTAAPWAVLCIAVAVPVLHSDLQVAASIRSVLECVAVVAVVIIGAWMCKVTVEFVQACVSVENAPGLAQVIGGAVVVTLLLSLLHSFYTLHSQLHALQSRLDSLPPAPRCVLGSVDTFPMEAVPEGFIECDGRTLSRSAYPQLFSILRVTYGVGDGVTTFGIPDYRGQFLRGWSHGSSKDPDAQRRTARGDGTAGDFVGTSQLDQVQDHTHPYTDKWWEYGSSGVGAYVKYSQSHYNVENKVTGGMVSGRVGAETRPVNVNVLFAICAKPYR